MDHNEIMVHAINAYIAAAIVRVEGMKAENAKRSETGQAVAYGEAAFMSEAQYILGYAEDLQQRSQQ